MICCSIQNKTPEEISSILDKVEMAEIRMDMCRMEDEDIREIFLSDIPLIATCRAKNGDFHETERLLTLAVKAGANYADLEIEAPGSVARRIQRVCAEYGTVLIRSYHDYEGTGSIDSLRAMADKCRNMGGQIVKIVTTASNGEDVARVLSLYRYYSPEGLVAFARGEAGCGSRLECLVLGSPFTYASVGKDDNTDVGQLPYEEMCELLLSKAHGRHFSFSTTTALRLPASKSFAQRAIIAAALAKGRSVLRAYSACLDSEAAIRAAESMGAKISRIAEEDEFETLEVEGIGAGPDMPAVDAQGKFNVGESGLLARLMIPLAAQIYGTRGAMIEAEGSLLKRPMQGADTMMRAFGADISCPDGSSLRQGGDEMLLPVRVSGPLRGGRAVIDGSRTSQLISGALISLPLAAKYSTLIIEKPTSIPYLFITMDILRRFGIKTGSRMFGDGEMLSDDWQSCDSIEIRVKENQRYRACEMTIEADWSAASVFMAAGAIFGKACLKGLDTSSLQADIMMLDLLMDAGASISQLEDSTGLLTIRKAPLRAIEADLSNCPDLFPVTAVLCAFCQGTSRLAGIRRLVHKESDRAQGIAEMLKKLGVSSSIKGDVLNVTGESLAGRILNAHLLHSGNFTSNHDHRMVMALSLASLGADGPIEIDDTDCVGKSFPSFINMWKNNIK